MTMRAADPKRRLLYSMPTITPLLDDSHGVQSALEVRRNGQLLTRPQLLVVRVTARGRHDITAADFEGAPLGLDVGESILDLLAATSSPRDSPVPLIGIDGRNVHIGPSLLHRNQTVTISLLIDGGSPHLSQPTASLANVRLQPDSAQRPYSVRRAIGASVSVMVVTVAVAVMVALVPVGKVAAVAAVVSAEALAVVAAVAVVDVQPRKRR